jgi:sulfate permease, SulP family
VLESAASKLVPRILVGLRGLVASPAWSVGYQRSDLRGDLLAGVVTAALVLPQALGYAGIARVPLQVGLYAVPAALVAYALIGTSRDLFVGPVSTVSVLTGSLLLGASADDPARAAALAAGLAIAAGLVLLVMGAFKLGWVAEFLSRPIVTGFVLGLVVLIVVGEIPAMLGVRPATGALYTRLYASVQAVPRANPTTLVIGLAALVVLQTGRRISTTVPWGLVVLTAGVLISRQWDLPGHGVAVVGPVPGGLPVPRLPALSLDDLSFVLLAGAGLAMVGLAEGLGAARLFAARGGYQIDSDREFVAAGAANLAAGLFGGLGVAGSLSKTAAAAKVGARTPFYGVVAAAVAAVGMVFAGLLSSLPRAVLSAVVIQAVWGLIDLPALRSYQRIRRNDFVAALVAFVGVLVLGPLFGLTVAIGQSLFGVVYRSGRVDVEVLGKIPGEKAGFGSLDRHPERHTYRSLLLLRPNAPLFWVNAALVHRQVVQLLQGSPGIRVVLLDLQATNQLDVTTADMLVDLVRQLRGRGVELCLVRVLRPAREVLTRSGFLAELGPNRMWHSIAQARIALKAEGLIGGPARHPRHDPHRYDPQDPQDPHEAGLEVESADWFHPDLDDLA